MAKPVRYVFAKTYPLYATRSRATYVSFHARRAPLPRKHTSHTNSSYSCPASSRACAPFSQSRPQSSQIRASHAKHSRTPSSTQMSHIVAPHPSHLLVHPSQERSSHRVHTRFEQLSQNISSQHRHAASASPEHATHATVLHFVHNSLQSLHVCSPHHAHSDVLSRITNASQSAHDPPSDSGRSAIASPEPTPMPVRHLSQSRVLIETRERDDHAPCTQSFVKRGAGGTGIFARISRAL